MKRTIYRQKRLEHNIQGNARGTKGTWQERRHVAFIPSHCLQRYDLVGTISSDQLEGTGMRNFSNIEDNPKSPTFIWTVLWRWDNVLLTCSLTVSRFRTQSGLHNQNAGFISFSLPFLLWSLLSRDNVLLTCSLTVSRFRTQSGLHNQNAGFISFSLPFLLWSLLSRDNVLLTVLWLSHVSGLNPDPTTRMQDSSPFRYHSCSLRWCSFDMFFDCLTFPDSIRTPQPECRIHLLFVTIPPLISLVQR